MKIRANNLKSIYDFFKSELIEFYSQNEIKLFFEIALENYLGLKFSDFQFNPKFNVSESELLKFNFCVKDLKKNKPIQQIVGNTIFYGFPFKVNEHVLIPRPETEELVELILKDFPNQKASFIDAGTGSGCIPISLVLKNKNLKAYAIDISTEALKVAKENAVSHNIEISFYKLDILKDDFSTINSEIEFDFVVSNPPYIKPSEQKYMSNNVLNFEPHLALFSPEEDYLIFYRNIISKFLKQLKSGGYFYFEINQKARNDMFNLMQSFGLINIMIMKDISGNDRFAKAQKK